MHPQLAKGVDFLNVAMRQLFLGSKFLKVKIVLNLSKILSRNLGKGYNIILL